MQEPKFRVKEFLLILCFVLALCYPFFCCMFFYLGQVHEQSKPKPVPTIESIQIRLGCEKIDGKLCAGWMIKGHSETQRLWDLAYANESAERYFTESGRPK